MILQSGRGVLDSRETAIRANVIILEDTLLGRDRGTYQVSDPYLLL